MTRHVAAVIATYGRPGELQRLFASLAGVDSVYVCDNSARPDIREIVERSPVRARYIAPDRNLGCGGGLRAAEERAWADASGDMTHLLVLDDDAVLQPDTVETLAAALERERAVAGYPLVTGPPGTVGWTPGLRDRRLHRLGTMELSPDEYQARCGDLTPEFDWAQGICLLIRRDIVDRAGFHRDDFWVRGEDLDFSLRLTALGHGIMVPRALAQHLPPEPKQGSMAAEYLRHASMVQNIAFLALTQPHGKRLRGSIPGAAKRFLKLWGVGALADLGRALWRGGALAEAAGTGKGQTFLRRFNDLTGA